MDGFEAERWLWLSDEERGTWREDLRSRYAPRFDEMLWGFDGGDGWHELSTEVTAEISHILGGPDSFPDLRVTQV